MRRPDRSPCVVCGATFRVERNHVAGRANDPGLTVPMCRPCHDAFTDWQWRLGVLRHETADERAAHGDLERAWALVEGFVILASLGPPLRDLAPVVTLGRAVGTLATAAATVAGDAPRWGPKPAMRKGPARPLPPTRGRIRLADLLRLMAVVSARLGADDPRLGEIATHAEVSAERAISMAHSGALGGRLDLEGVADQAVTTLLALDEIGSLDEIVARGDELAELAAFAELTLSLFGALAAAESDEAAVAAVATSVRFEQ